MTKKADIKIFNKSPCWLEILRGIPGNKPIKLTTLSYDVRKSYNLVQPYVKLFEEKGWVVIDRKAKSGLIRDIKVSELGEKILHDFRRVGDEL